MVDRLTKPQRRYACSHSSFYVLLLEDLPSKIEKKRSSAPLWRSFLAKSWNHSRMTVLVSGIFCKFFWWDPSPQVPPFLHEDMDFVGFFCWKAYLAILGRNLKLSGLLCNIWSLKPESKVFLGGGKLNRRPTTTQAKRETENPCQANIWILTIRDHLHGEGSPCNILAKNLSSRRSSGFLFSKKEAPVCCW